jgi:hypothetical protein
LSAAPNTLFIDPHGRNGSSSFQRIATRAPIRRFTNEHGGRSVLRVGAIPNYSRSREMRANPFLAGPAEELSRPSQLGCPPRLGPSRMTTGVAGSEGRAQEHQPVERRLVGLICPGQRPSHNGSGGATCLTRASPVRHELELSRLSGGRVTAQCALSPGVSRRADDGNRTRVLSLGNGSSSTGQQGCEPGKRASCW